MRCTKPLRAYKLNTRHPKTGKNVVVVVKNNSGYFPDNIKEAIHVPCGRCMECRLERSRVWAIRCMHELQMYDLRKEESYFLTLTYDDKKVEHNNNLHPDHLRDFWKRLRKTGYKFKYFACGEYGDRTDRPHYHAIVFGLTIPDRRYYNHSNGYNLYNSETIERIWMHGNVIIGNVTFESCAYVARYITKKRLGKNADKEVREVDHETGEIIDERFPEFTRMSMGIGKDFLQRFSSDIYKKGCDGTVYIRGGVASTAPRYYDVKTEEVDRILIEGIKEKRKEVASKKQINRDRLHAREKIAVQKEKLLKRTI